MANEIQFDADSYTSFLRTLKQRIESAQVRAALSVNRELVMLYWQLGRDILLRQQHGGWGAKIIDQLSHDLRAAFPELKGFSRRNLSYMRAFAEAWPDETIVQQVAAQLPWFHNCILLDKVDTHDKRLWYTRRAIEAGWSRNILVHQLESGLYERQGRALTNFANTLPPAQSDLARQMLKDPYNFDFLSLGQDAQERDLERGLLAHLQAFLLEMGVGLRSSAANFISKLAIMISTLICCSIIYGCAAMLSSISRLAIFNRNMLAR